ncbi:MAG: glutathione S-transferase family protein, partial [Cucumibacter sp.]
ISGSPYAWWVMLAAEVKGLAYESHLLSVSNRENYTPEYLAMNRRGRVPLLKDGDFILTESMAMVAYLDTKSTTSPLFGGSPRETARIWEAASQVVSDVGRASSAFNDPILSTRGKPLDADSVREAAATLKTELGFFEERLAAGRYFCGPTLSAADIALLPFLLFSARVAGRDAVKDMNLGLLPLVETFPKLAAWVKRIEALPGYEKTYPPHWRTS